MRIDLKSRLPIVLLLSLSLFIPSIAGTEDGLDGGLSTDGAVRAGDGCTCHGTAPDAGVVPRLTMVNSEAIVEGNTYVLEVSFTGGPAEGGENSGGFLVNVDSGTFVAPDGNVLVDGDEATHSAIGNDQRSWEIEWTADSADVAEFTLRTNSVDGGGDMNEGDDWNMATFYLNPDGRITQTQIEPEARFDAPGWTQNLILALSGLMMIILSVLALNPKSKGRRKEFD